MLTTLRLQFGLVLFCIPPDFVDPVLRVNRLLLVFADGRLVPFVIMAVLGRLPALKSDPLVLLVEVVSECPQLGVSMH